MGSESAVIMNRTPLVRSVVKVQLVVTTLASQIDRMSVVLNTAITKKLSIMAITQPKAIVMRSMVESMAELIHGGIHGRTETSGDVDCASGQGICVGKICGQNMNGEAANGHHGESAHVGLLCG